MDMKARMPRMVPAGILVAAIGVGFWMARSAGTSSTQLAWTLQDQEAMEQYQDYSVGPAEAAAMKREWTPRDQAAVGQYKDYLAGPVDKARTEGSASAVCRPAGGSIWSGVIEGADTGDC